jgi:hypothetical protein
LHERETSGAGRWRHGFYTLREIPSVDEEAHRFIPFWVMLYACITEIEKKTGGAGGGIQIQANNKDTITWTHNKGGKQVSKLKQ